MIKRIYLFKEDTLKMLKFVCAEKGLGMSEAIGYCIKETYKTMFPEKTKE